ncbi:apolipoprotein N-acyltransferase [Streptomyces violaceorubidus]
MARPPSRRSPTPALEALPVLAFPGPALWSGLDHAVPWIRSPGPRRAPRARRARGRRVRARAGHARLAAPDLHGPRSHRRRSARCGSPRLAGAPASLGGRRPPPGTAAALAVLPSGCWRSWSAPGRGSAAPGGRPRQPVAGGPGAAPRLGGRRVAAQLPGGGRQRRARRPRRRAPRQRPALPGLLAAAAATSAAWVWSPRPGTDERAAIAVVQPGVVAGAGSADRRFDRQERLTRRLADRDLDLIVWGESSVGFDLEERPDLAPAARRAVPGDRGGHPGQRGRAALRQTRLYKSRRSSAPRARPATGTTRCDSSPSGSTCPSAHCSAGPPRGKAAGGPAAVQRDVVHVGDGLRIGPMVCFESAFPDMSRSLAADDAGDLVAQSSTSTVSTPGLPSSTPRSPRCAPPRPAGPRRGAAPTGVAPPSTTRTARGSAPARHRRQRLSGCTRSPSPPAPRLRALRRTGRRPRRGSRSARW